MPLNIRDEQVDRLAARLAGKTGSTKTLAVKRALENELERIERAEPLWDRLASLRRRISDYPDTGLAADKAFFDSLDGDA
jgi:antitoxin VapB